MDASKELDFHDGLHLLRKIGVSSNIERYRIAFASHLLLAQLANVYCFYDVVLVVFVTLSAVDGSKGAAAEFALRRTKSR